jgi:hypothetical protein
MESLYNIEQELLDIFEEVEQNDGVITDEQLERLAITKQEFYQKLESYQKARLVWKGNVEVIKEEIKRLTQRKQVFENRIDRLTSAMKAAVFIFGDTGKSGNKVIELPTFKFFIKTTQSTEVDENRIDLLINCVFNHMREMYENSAITLGSEVDIEGLLAAINANGYAEDINFIPFTIEDLIATQVDIINKSSLFDLITQEDSMLPAYLKAQQKFQVEANTSKTYFKEHLQIQNLTVANIKFNESLQVK